MVPTIRQTVEGAWDAIWSSGVTNPILVTELLGTLLMAASEGFWARCFVAARDADGGELALLLAQARRSHGIGAGSEIESPDFWLSTTAAARGMELLAPIVDKNVDSDILGDIYEHILSRMGSAGQFGQFRTPRHIIDFMVHLVGPSGGECVVDPASGTAGFLIAAADYRRIRGLSGTAKGIEIDRTVARIATANLRFHRVPNAQVETADGLLPVAPDADVILANPPFAGSVSDAVADLYAIRTRKTELLFLEAMMARLRPSGRAAVIVPTSVLTAGNAAARSIREALVKNNHLLAVIELPSGVFRPYTDVKTAILVWTRRKPAKSVLMVRVQADGFSLDQRRQPCPEDDLPPALALFHGNTSAEVAHAVVQVADILDNGLSLNPSRYIAIEAADQTTFEAPDVLADIDATMRRLNNHIAALRRELA